MQRLSLFTNSKPLPESDNLDLLATHEKRKRTQSFKQDIIDNCSMSLMMKEESPFITTTVMDDSKALLFKELTCNVMQSSHVIKCLPKVDHEQLERKKITLPKKTNLGKQQSKKSTCDKWKTIIFDMDETLIHKVGSQDSNREADFYVTVPTEDLTGSYKLGINIRPYAVECLEEANKYFEEVIVFTAGTKNYADSILDILDPHKNLIQHRLYRDSCIAVDCEGATFYIKDLRILEERKLKDMVIVDNSVISFASQIDNGIPILPFKEDKNDCEFLQLMKIMEDISLEKDCRNFIRNKFKISDIVSTDTDSYAHLYDMSDSDDDSTEEDLLDSLLQCTRTLSMSQKSIKEPKKKLRKCKKRARPAAKKFKKVQSFSGKNIHDCINGMNTYNFPESSKCVIPGEALSPFEVNSEFQKDEEKSVKLS